ncbi:uncharacterized protein LOC135371250 [Ornithodoros turicata]|uniref:uncharacterized protein LOC135371250 n=1 Tax=Ornithodoros turicata TaxID=34597 RepID=UPI003139F1DD
MMTSEEGRRHSSFAKVDLRSDGLQTVVPDSRRSWLICLCAFSILFWTNCLLHSEPVFSTAFSEMLQISKSSGEWPLYLSYLSGSLLAPAAGFLTRSHPKTLIISATLAVSLILMACFPFCDYIFWTILVGFFLGGAIGATKTVCVFIVNACFRQYRSIGNGLSLSGNALAAYVGAPFLHSLTNEFGIKGSLLLMGGITMNAVIAALVISRHSFDTSQEPEEERVSLPTVKLRMDFENKVIMEETASTIDDEDFVKTSVKNWSLSSVDAVEERHAGMNVIECVAVIEHWGDDADSCDNCPMGFLESAEKQTSEFNTADDAPGDEHDKTHDWDAGKDSTELNPLLQRRGSWYHEDKAMERRRRLLKKWVSSSIESLRSLGRSHDDGYTRLVDIEVGEKERNDRKDVLQKDTQDSVEDAKNTRSVSFSAGTTGARWRRNSATREKLKLHRAKSQEGCIVRHVEDLNLLEHLPLEAPQSELPSQEAQQVDDKVSATEAAGLSRSSTEQSLDKDSTDLPASHISDAQAFSIPVEVPVTRRYSRLAQDILIRQLQDRQRNRFYNYVSVFRNPTLYIICIASSVMLNSIIIFLTKLADVLRAKQLSPTSLKDKMLPTFHIGDIAACLCSGWFTDEGHLRVRRAIAIDLLILGSSMLIVPLHTSLNTFAIQSLLQGWAFGQSTVLFPVLLVKALGMTSCGLAYGVVMFATGVSTLLRQLLEVHFRGSFGTQDFIFNFHGILALAIAGVFAVETQFNRALERRKSRTQEL